MSEKNCPKVDGEFYHLCYENKDHKAMSLEDCLTGVSERLRGKSWAKDQRTDLVVIGTDETGVDYVLNSPTIGALDTFSEDYDGGMLVLKRISNDRVKTVTVRNMVLRGKESIIFEGKVVVPRDGDADYVTLLVEKFSMTTHELKSFMDEMMALHMLNVATYPAIRLLRSKYSE